MLFVDSNVAMYLVGSPPSAEGGRTASAGLSARDAVHLAAMERAGVRRIATFDQGYDRWPGIERIG